MNKTDVIFYLSLIANVGALFAKLAGGLISTTTLTWIGIISAIISFIAYALYEKINGTTPPPSAPVNQ